MGDPLVSVIIPTYNRFPYLMKALDSVHAQTYKNLEIIVINDASSGEDYTSYDWASAGVKILHLPQNSSTIYGYGCAAHVRNAGITLARGQYLAFLDDDDDVWLPDKISRQVEALQSSGLQMCCTEGYIGQGVYDPTKKYRRYNSEHYYGQIRRIFSNKGSTLMDAGYPDIWTREFITVHNCVITSSVVISRDLVAAVNGFKTIRKAEDYDLWKRATLHTDITYVQDPLFYYDLMHGDGRLY